MNKYTVKLRIFGKGFAVKVDANSKSEAKYKALESIRLQTIVDNIEQIGSGDEAMDFLKNIFGIK